ncbi:MAG: hypothetical protein ACTSQY_00245 [Candidatus Odinarchaeia archaeon]|nr:MAG: hypothetical protein [Lokiarchaeota virus Fenrir Meg22_1012]URC17228.1 MAG: hypothetical protein [Lokiarchaeota virus Fenrir Meg22_1214]
MSKKEKRKKMLEKYKKLTKEEKKQFNMLFNMLKCPKDCSKCEKTIDKCLIELRSLVELLLKYQILDDKKTDPGDAAMGMVS